ncbi:peroxiredoxin [Phycicoccus sonneratiae]|uniref:thioredoxin-dependent peroxiredoxin n=1 Tax=Phycicoccus sonneratiae TaxID=2807628 RepID=A0ABS2CHG9_9MICO|nr:peroxiredoxin [Phycicoccus sonneraticus]MBM6399318.1 peroxiredoxin [Phycicoccus sonneraticus]
MTAATRPLAVGDLAPDFTLRDQNGADVSLSALTAEKNVVVVFYPWAFSGICTGELDEIRDHLERFVSDDLQVVCVSCDAVFSIRAWADIQGYFFPLLSDAWPHGAVARAYGVLNEGSGAAQRGTFLVGRDGRIAWTLVNGPGEPRDFSDLPSEVAALVG